MMCVCVHDDIQKIQFAKFTRIISMILLQYNYDDFVSHGQTHRQTDDNWYTHFLLWKFNFLVVFTIPASLGLESSIPRGYLVPNIVLHMQP